MQEKLNLFSHKVGSLEIHEEQARCAIDINDIFKRNGGPPLLIAQPQQGKTEDITAYENPTKSKEIG